ncbi:hypothetical protein STRDD13_01003 [Streptococcus sp. DD13]|nr:hypothetical protein STRDD13_01003 [Streptococcus sp. DD13]
MTPSFFTSFIDMNLHILETFQLFPKRERQVAFGFFLILETFQFC